MSNSTTAKELSRFPITNIEGKRYKVDVPMIAIAKMVWYRILRQRVVISAVKNTVTNELSAVIRAYAS